MYKIIIYRDAGNFQTFYKANSVIQFKGNVTKTGQSNVHYIWDVKHSATKAWFRTNNDCDPFEIPISVICWAPQKKHWMKNKLGPKENIGEKDWDKKI